ncbi:hypothetical protein FSARC_11282 [Fusarium sarcochroum]|uniref:Uncharacterized protein n=1 Tax=Fusarium sarcochroum TaxID=1208366 RepID=A0A8H4X1F7_9HYPO|nr:hypothetical protein FSARC_11282 [Fusarium sarcochroum]
MGSNKVLSKYASVAIGEQGEVDSVGDYTSCSSTTSKHSQYSQHHSQTDASVESLHDDNRIFACSVDKTGASSQTSAWLWNIDRPWEGFDIPNSQRLKPPALSEVVVPRHPPHDRTRQGIESTQGEQKERGSKADPLAQSASEKETSAGREMPTIYRLIQTYFSADPSYAKEIVRAVDSLPCDKRTLLLSPNNNVPEDDPGSPSQNLPSAKGKEVSGQPSKRERGRQSDEQDSGQNPNDKSHGSGGGKGAPDPKKQCSKSDKRWACPYCLVHPRILGITKFITCRPPGSMKKRSDWRNHMKKVHSPDARPVELSEDTALYYMTNEQWTEVRARIDEADLTRRRDYEEWFEVQKTCYLAVWRIIFPPSEYPDLPEPISPFHPDGDEIGDLGRQGLIIFEAIFNARTRRAVNSHLVESVGDFRPDHRQYMSMMAEAFAIVAGNSPGAAQWAVNSSPEALRDAVSRNRENDSPPSTLTDPQKSEASQPSEEPELSQSVSPRTSCRQEPSSSSLPDIAAQDGLSTHMQVPPGYAHQVNPMPVFSYLSCI